MNIYLSALGWVNEGPIGNRLRWSFDPEFLVDDQFIGLPRTITVQRAFFRNTIVHGESIISDHPSWPVPQDWWESLPNMQTPATSPSFLQFPKVYQSIRFQYSGSQNRMQVFGPQGKLLQERDLQNGDQVILEGHGLLHLLFLGGPALLTMVQGLDLFGPHGEGLAWDTLAILDAGRPSQFSHAKVYSRYGGGPGISEEEWEEFRTLMVPEAQESSPESVALAPDEPSPWTQFRLLANARWEYSCLNALGFLDGPDAGTGTGSDQVNAGMLLNSMPNRPMVYRVLVRYSDDQVFTSNLMPVPAQLAAPLPVPHRLEYINPQVRLFGEDDYMMKGAVEAEVNHPLAIGVELEEEIGESPIFHNPVEVNTLEFQSWKPTDYHRRMQLSRELELPFYDTPLRLRGRSLDGWDRFSELSDWTLPVVPHFKHHPPAPPLIGAAHIDGDIHVFIDHPDQSFRAWEPDHAVANTPGSTLELYRRTSAPALQEITIFQIGIHLQEASGTYKVRIPLDLNLPGRFIGGYLIAGRMKAEILRIEDDHFLILPTGNSIGTTDLFEPGPATLQQSPNHPSLWTQVGNFLIDELPQFLREADPLPPPVEQTDTQYYAIQVNMVSLVGPIGALVPALRHPAPLDTPPPFTIAFLGRDFYGRTLVKVAFTQPVGEERFKLFWARGALNATDFSQLSVQGDSQSQQAYNGTILFESLPLPSSQTPGRMITIGAQQESSGGFQSNFSVVSIELPVESSS